MAASGAGPGLTLAALGCAVAGQLVLFTADELAACSHETGTRTGEWTRAGEFVLLVGGLGAAALAVAGIVAVVRSRLRGPPRPSRLWIALAALVSLPAGLALVLAFASGGFACGVGL